MVAVTAGHAESDKPIHPLRQWRERYGVSQGQLAELTGLTQGMISHIERYFRIPLGEKLEALIQETGLPADAFVRAERFMAEQPNFLRKYRRRPKGRGRSASREDQ